MILQREHGFNKSTFKTSRTDFLHLTSPLPWQSYFFLSRQEYWGPEGKSDILKSNYMSVKGRNNCWWKGSLYFDIRCFDLSTSSSGLFSPPLFRNILLICSINVFQTSIHRYILVSTWFITLNRNSLSLELIPCKFKDTHYIPFQILNCKIKHIKMIWFPFEHFPFFWS